MDAFFTPSVDILESSHAYQIQISAPTISTAFDYALVKGRLTYLVYVQT